MSEQEAQDWEQFKNENPFGDSKKESDRFGSIFKGIASLSDEPLKMLMQPFVINGHNVVVAIDLSPELFQSIVEDESNQMTKKELLVEVMSRSVGNLVRHMETSGIIEKRDLRPLFDKIFSNIKDEVFNV